MNKLIIGITALYDSERASYWMLPGYMKGIEEAGGIPIMLPLTADKEVVEVLCAQCDGLLLTGGQDVSPALYGMSVSPACGEICHERDAMEEQLLRSFMRRDKPVLGICRGIQLLNAVLGGTLYQDLPTEYPSEVVHQQKPPYDVPAHGVSLVPGTPLHRLLRRDTLPVNSCHHQAIRMLSPHLVPMAMSPDGLVEAAFMPEARFIWAVQWHPEFSYRTDEGSRMILRAFVEQAGSGGAK